MSLLAIQKLQFSDKEQAEKELLVFLQKNEDSSIQHVELTPRPQSLNSINGFLTYDNGERLFFKTHVEENEQLSEYYNAALLRDAGYPLVSAKQITHRPGKQIVLYDTVSLPTMFDCLKGAEDVYLKSGVDSSSPLLKAQQKLDQRVFEIYVQTLGTQSVDENERAPINQLFSHRLADEGRLGLYYKNESLSCGGLVLPFSELAAKRWLINGVRYKDNLSDIITRARCVLTPAPGASIVGHGDAHNGNVFVDYDAESLYLFDPAFAGVHSPLLDLTKPILHNVFARWMYYPEEVASEITLNYQVGDDEIVIEHSFMPSALRLAHLQSRILHVLKPTLALLKEKKLLAENWQEQLRSSLFCCPFLTVNLFAKYKEQGTLAERYPLAIKLLALALTVEFGATFHSGTSALTDLIDNIACGEH